MSVHNFKNTIAVVAGNILTGLEMVMLLQQSRMRTNGHKQLEQQVMSHITNQITKLVHLHLN